MHEYPGNYSLPHQLVGEVDSDQVGELFSSGWRFNPDDQLWVKVFYAIDGAPETPPFLAALIEQLKAQNIVSPGPYPGSEDASAPASAASASSQAGPWSPVTSVIADAFHEPDFSTGDDDTLMGLLDAAFSQGFAIVLDWKGDFELQEICRGVCDWRVGWSNEDFGRMEELVFVWDDQGASGHVDQGLLAFDHYLQERGTAKRLVSIDTGSDFYASFVIPAERAGDLIAGFNQCGLQAQLQDGGQTAQTSGQTAAPVSVAAPAAALQNVIPRLERMPLGQAGAVPPMASMKMSMGDANMPGRTFSHEIGVLFVGDQNSVVMSDQVAEAGLDEDQLLQLSIDNLAGQVASLEVVRMGSMIMLTGANGLEACMALVPSLWEDTLAENFPNGPVIVMPSKDVLAAVDRNDVDGLAGLRRAAGQVLAQNPDSLLGSDLYQRRADGAWVVFDEAAQSTDSIAQPTTLADAEPAKAYTTRNPPGWPWPPETTAFGPPTRVEDAGLEAITVHRDEIGDNLGIHRTMMMAKSGYKLNLNDDHFHRVFVGEAGAPDRPWLTPEWNSPPTSAPQSQPKKKRFWHRK